MAKKKRKQFNRYKQGGQVASDWLASHDFSVWVIVIPTVIAVISLFVVATRF